MISRKQAVDDHCKSCLYDQHAAGNWRQQVTLCSVTHCHLHAIRPTSRAPIPDSVLSYYGLPKGTLSVRGEDNSPNQGHTQGAKGKPVNKSVTSELSVGGEA